MSENLFSALNDEISRIEGRLIPIYESIGPPAAFALLHIKASLMRAKRARDDMDVARMISALSDLRSCE